MTIRTKEQAQKLADYFSGVLKEMLDSGCQPTFVNINIHHGKDEESSLGNVSYNSLSNVWSTYIKGKGIVYKAPNSDEICGQGQSVDCLVRGLTEIKDKARDLIADMLRAIEQEGISREMILGAWEEAMIEETDKESNRDAPNNNKPTWKDAPHWANWLAQDNDGSWYWYKVKPRCVAVSWAPREDEEGRRVWCFIKRDNLNVNWKDTLEERPN